MNTLPSLGTHLSIRELLPPTKSHYLKSSSMVSVSLSLSLSNLKVREKNKDIRYFGRTTDYNTLEYNVQNSMQSWDNSLQA